ncbi:MAG: hypothetical protein AB7E49_11730 [Campylobacterales bacterium]
MYEQEKSVSCGETADRLKDLEAKILSLDNHFNRKNFTLKCGEHELHFDNFLAKHVLSAIRSTLQHEVNELHKQTHHDACERP